LKLVPGNAVNIKGREFFIKERKPGEVIYAENDIEKTLEYDEDSVIAEFGESEDDFLATLLVSEEEGE